MSEANELPDNALITDSDDPNADQGKLTQIRKRFQVHQTFWSEIHAEGLKDDRFVAGDQWPDAIRQERMESNRPILTYNLLPSFTRQITNKMRQERTSIKVIPVESNRGNSPTVQNVAGTKDYSLADVYSGIIKNIEHLSRADQAYDTAAKHAVDHGFGFFYLINEWSVTDPFVQELRMYRVKNSYSVTLDPSAQEIDYRDAQDGFMYTNMNKATFEKKYPDAQPSSFNGAGNNYEGWYESDSVRVAQYFWIEYKNDEVLLLSNGKTVYLSDVESVLDEMEEEQGIYVTSDAAGKEMRRDVKRPVCMWQKMTANEVLEGPTELPFSAVPIFPVLGEELVLDGRTIYESAVRQAKDAQRSYNYWRTAAAEAVALTPRAPYMGTARQFEGHEEQFENANSTNDPYMIYNHVEGVPPPQRQYPANVAAAELSNAVQDGTDMQTIIGLHDASLGRDGNEKSGKAILARQNQGNTATFQFPDNLARAQMQCARLMVEAIPRIYDTRRILRIRLGDDNDDFVEINTGIVDKETKEIVLVHDLGYGKYDVVMDSTPSYATQRQEAADLQMELLKVLGPEQASSIVHLIVRNLGVPGSDEVAAILRKLLPEQLKTEEEKLADLPKGVTQDENGQLVDESGQPWQPEPTPDQQLMAKQQEIDAAKTAAEMATAEATKATAQADIKQAEAKAARANADMAKAQSEMAALANPADPQAGQAEMMQGIEQVIKQAFAEHEANPQAHATATAEQVTDAVVEALTRVKKYVDRQQSKPAKQTI